MGSNYKLNKIPLKTTEDAMEFIDMVAVKLPLVKALLKKHALERQSLLNRLSQTAQAQPVNSYSDDDVQTSVLDRATGRTSKDASDTTDRIAQLRAAQTPQPEVDPGEIGQLEIEDNTEAKYDEIEEAEIVEQPSQEDLTPIGSRVSGKAEGLKTVKRRQARANDLRKK